MARPVDAPPGDRQYWPLFALGSFQERLRDLRAFAFARLSNIRELIGRKEAILEARALLAQQFGKFTLNRVKHERG
jgi:hypothetical protein